MNNLVEYLLNYGIIHPSFVQDYRFMVLVKYKYIKGIDVYCDSNNMEIKVTVHLKWYHIFYNKNKLESFTRFIFNKISSGVSILSENKGLEQFEQKKYEVSIEYVR
jgi:hypothetical protein